MATHRTGGEVDAYCARCKLTLAHTILAMVGTRIARVRCNTCGADHARRSAPGAEKPPRAGGAARERVVLTFEAQLEGKDVAAAKPYKPQTTYRVDDVFYHPTFGVGIVTGVRGDKLEASFKSAQKTLVHGRGDAQAQRPTYHPPAAASEAPADKPTGPAHE